jgi:hypothetical protein
MTDLPGLDLDLDRFGAFSNRRARGRSAGRCA